MGTMILLIFEKTLGDAVDDKLARELASECKQRGYQVKRFVTAEV